MNRCKAGLLKSLLVERVMLLVNTISQIETENSDEDNWLHYLEIDRTIKYFGKRPCHLFSHSVILNP